MTWITLALSNGVPIEVVQMVTGHETMEIVLKHYLRPGPEQFQAIIHRAMPELLAGKEQIPTHGNLSWAWLHISAGLTIRIPIG